MSVLRLVADTWNARGHMLGFLRNGQFAPLGTVTLLGPHTWVTCAHLLPPGNPQLAVAIIQVEPWTPVEKLDRAFNSMLLEVVEVHEELDLAFLTSAHPLVLSAPDGTENPRLRVRTATPELGEDVFVVGFPFLDLQRLNRSQSHGNVSSLLLTDNFGVRVRTLQLDAMCHEGNSGGPVVSSRTSALLGIVTGRFDPTTVRRAVSFEGLRDSTNLAFAVSVHHVMEALPDKLRDDVATLENPRVGRDWSGASLVTSLGQVDAILAIMAHHRIGVSDEEFRRLFADSVGKQLADED